MIVIVHMTRWFMQFVPRCYHARRNALLRPSVPRDDREAAASPMRLLLKETRTG